MLASCGVNFPIRLDPFHHEFQDLGAEYVFVFLTSLLLQFWSSSAVYYVIAAFSVATFAAAAATAAAADEDNDAFAVSQLFLQV
jgi:hypothetical protein